MTNPQYIDGERLILANSLMISIEEKTRKFPHFIDLSVSMRLY